MRRTRRVGAAAHIAGAAFVAVLLLMHVRVSAQEVTGAALKAAFIYNFAIFTEWPADVVPASGPFVMCVLGDSAVGDALDRTVKGRAIAGRGIIVSRVVQAGPPQVCHVLYVSGVPANQAARIVTGLRDEPVLTISDIEGFTESGGIAQFFFRQGRLRFSVQLESARRARLQISSKLILLAERHD